MRSRYGRVAPSGRILWHASGTGIVTMRFPVLLAVTASFTVTALAGSDLHSSGNPAILAANLDSLRVPGKVNGVLWTRRADIFTLQVLVPRSAQRGAGMPDIDAWLLRAD